MEKRQFTLETLEESLQAFENESCFSKRIILTRAIKMQVEQLGLTDDPIIGKHADYIFRSLQGDALATFKGLNRAAYEMLNRVRGLQFMAYLDS
jgi:hypothetical protein